jgi:hypothetical protein
LSELRDCYLLPCSCGRNVIVQPRNAGETVRCECGRETTAPTMREIRRLQPAEAIAARDATPGEKTPWGKSQRLLLVGTVVIVLAAILAMVLFYGQYRLDQRIAHAIHNRREHVRTLKLFETLQWYRRNVAPGFDTADESPFQRDREVLFVGEMVAAIAAAAGIVLVGIGIAGLRKRSG